MTILPGLSLGVGDLTLGGGTGAAPRVLSNGPPRDPGAEDDPGLTLGGGTQPSAQPSAGENGPLTPGQSFGPRYHVVKLLGLGGMGAVYQAWDSELGVVVALKVIRPETAADDPTAARELERRFKRELLLARQVTHKNVVRIHDMGELNGIKYITMPFIAGQDLATVLEQHGRLGVQRTLAIARGVVSGLVAAHDAGVVHRDLKPPNIMIGEDDEPLIMDFGIALSTGKPEAASRSGPWAPFPGAAAVTSAGEIVGTLEYMAPEQARAETVDQRADIYALGLILYDMLLGRRRHDRAESAVAELRGRLLTAPAPPRSIDPTIPEAVDALVARCLQPDAAARFQSSSELAAALARLDEDGIPLPQAVSVSRRLAATGAAAIVLMLASILSMNWWLVRSEAPATAHAPVTVLIADFTNTTGDPTFDQTLEPTLRRALEGAGFINAYDRTRTRQAFGVAAPARLDESAARQLAMKQGVSVVLAGSISLSGGAYEISMRAIQPISANVAATATARANRKEQVLGGVAKVSAILRRALGEKTSEADQLFAMRSISRGSLDAISQYASGIRLESQGRYEEAIANFRRAIQLDPNLGVAYNSLAVGLKNIGRIEEARKAAQEALRHVDGMTERERLATRGYYFRLTGDFQQCVKEYGELTANYPADTVAHNNRAVCYGQLRDYRNAMEEMRQALHVLPNHMTFRTNLALFAAYAGDFAAAEREFKAIPRPTADAMQVLPLSLLAQGRLQEATSAYEQMATMSAFGGQFAASGLGDLAAYEGRFADAVAIYRRGAEADIKAGNPEVAAEKLAALAHAQLSRGQRSAAIAAAQQALSNSQAPSVKFLGGRVLVEAGALDKARQIAAGLAAEIATEPQAYGKILEGEIALKQRNLAQAIKLLTDANGVMDTWIGHFDLGRAYLEGGAFTQADSEFDRCIKRRGEALMLVDQDPTYAYFPAVYYYLGRAREGLQTEGYVDLFREYLKIRGKSTDDALAADARRRAGL